MRTYENVKFGGGSCGVCIERCTVCKRNSLAARCGLVWPYFFQKRIDFASYKKKLLSNSNITCLSLLSFIFSLPLLIRLLVSHSLSFSLSLSPFEVSELCSPEYIHPVFYASFQGIIRIVLGLYDFSCILVLSLSLSLSLSFPLPVVNHLFLSFSSLTHSIIGVRILDFSPWPVFCWYFLKLFKSKFKLSLTPDSLSLPFLFPSCITFSFNWSSSHFVALCIGLYFSKFDQKFFYIFHMNWYNTRCIPKPPPSQPSKHTNGFQFEFFCFSLHLSLFLLLSSVLRYWWKVLVA